MDWIGLFLCSVFCVLHVDPIEKKNYYIYSLSVGIMQSGLGHIMTKNVVVYTFFWDTV